MEVSGIKLLGQNVEGTGVLAEEFYVKDSLGVREIQPGQVCIEARLG